MEYNEVVVRSGGCAEWPLMANGDGVDRLERSKVDAQAADNE